MDIDFHNARKPQPKKNTGLARIGLFFMILIFVTICSLVITCILLLRISSWRRDRPLGILVVSPTQEKSIRTHLGLLWIDPLTHKMTLVDIPDSMAVETIAYGTHTADTLYGIFSIDHKSVTVFAKALSFAFGIDLRAVLVYEHPIKLTDLNEWTFWNAAFFRSPRASLRFPELFSVFWFTHSLGSSERETLALPERLFSLQQSDGQQIMVADKVSLDRFMSKTFANPAIVTENVSLSVINSSGLAHTGALFGRFFTTNGCFLLSVDDTSEVKDDSQLLISSEKLRSTKTVEFLEYYLQTKATVDANTTAGYRSDAVVFIGKKQAMEITP
ncbi:MAG TPA: hypothetical protein VLH19_01660 [Patescibacteria group bacterium]|nr:hypothetical protein [Patescibacteria group bacterium]